MFILLFILTLGPPGQALLKTDELLLNFSCPPLTRTLKTKVQRPCCHPPTTTTTTRPPCLAVRAPHREAFALLPLTDTSETSYGIQYVHPGVRSRSIWLGDPPGPSGVTQSLIPVHPEPSLHFRTLSAKWTPWPQRSVYGRTAETCLPCYCVYALYHRARPTHPPKGTAPYSKINIPLLICKRMLFPPSSPVSQLLRPSSYRQTNTFS